MQRRHETPVRRVYSGGRVRWVARYTNREGRRVVAKPDWNGGHGMFELKREAQRAIDEAYAQEERARSRGPVDTVRAYAATWTQRRPRAERTNRSYNHRVGRVLEVELAQDDGTLRAFGEWPLDEVRRRQVNDLIDYLLRVQGRAHKGAVGILRVLSAMWQDAIDDECADFNPFMGAKIRASDPRIAKAPRVLRVYSWEDMRRFAVAAGAARTGAWDAWRPVYAEAMVRVLSDCGLRLGELPALLWDDFDGEALEVRRTAWQGQVQEGTKTDHGKPLPGRVVPVPASLADLLRHLPRRLDRKGLMFPTPRGHVWQESLFYREVWRPAQRATGLTVTPQEMRHSWVSLLRAEGIDPADLATYAGHTMDTATKHYTHALGRSADLVRRAIG